jgi:hypothetical protein
MAKMGKGGGGGLPETCPMSSSIPPPHRMSAHNPGYILSNPLKTTFFTFEKVSFYVKIIFVEKQNFRLFCTYV